MKKNIFLDMKRNSKKKKLTILSFLFLIFFLIPIFKNFDFNIDSNLNEQKNFKDFPVDNLKTQDLSSDNTFSGIGGAWNVSHWANRTDYNLAVNFGNGSSDSKYMDLGIGWEGYQLNATIKDLYDERNWVNGTFHCGSFAGNSPVGNNDSNYVSNWTFIEYDIEGTGSPPYENIMTGNYFDDAHADTKGQDCLELNIEGGGTGRGYDQGDACWWYTDFVLPRGEIIDGEINFAVFPETFNGYGNHFVFQVLINDVNVYTRGLLALVEESGNLIDGDWLNAIIPLDAYLDDPQVFPENVKDMDVKLKFKRVGETLDTGNYLTNYRLFVDNISMNLKTQVNATQIGLRMNNEPVSDSNEWGNGIVSQINTWTTPPVEVKFNSTETSPPPEMGGYTIEFTTDINLFAKKMSTDSHYQPNFVGTSFEVKNNSNVEWECYSRVSVPTGYEETNMTIKFPEDVNITWISNAEYPNTNILEYCDNNSQGLLKVSNFSETPDGFWWIKGQSPNYFADQSIYNNVTGSWVLNNIFLSGEYINISGKIISPTIDISGYIENTKAMLLIKFPNGTLWLAENQIKQVNDNGMVYFDPIMIPDNVPNYKAGEYEAIITWNNSYSSFDINETGVIYKKFTVIHDSILEPDQGISFIENVIDDQVINIKVSYNDIIDNTAIENALVYTNFTGTVQYFSEISPGFYLFEFNATKASAGNNTLTIHANSTYYLNKVINITVEVIKETLLVVENDFFTVPWKQNFTVRFNYTEKNNPTIGINTTDISIDFLGDQNLIQTVEGQYELECNTSAYDALTLQSFILSVNKYKYESQSILIRVQITELESSLKLFVNGDPVNSSDTVQVELIETINFTVYYEDNITTAHLSNATINIPGVGDLNEAVNQYTIIIDAVDLGQGISVLTVFAQLTNYQSQSINFFIEVFERATELILLLDGIPINDAETVQVELTDTLNFTAYYRDNETDTHLSNATVNMLGVGDLNEIINQYTRLIDAIDFGLGITVLTVFAQLANYQSQSINFFIEVFERATELILMLDGIPINDAETVQVELTDTLNFTAFYRDNETDTHLSNATVNMLGVGDLNETINQYTRLIDAIDFGQGITVLTVFAQLANYQSQSINFFIEVFERATELILLLDGIPTNASDTIQVELDESINVTVYYRDNEYKTHLTGASLILVGRGTLDEINNQYNISINAQDLEQGITVMTIFAQLTNYQSQSIQFFVEVVERSTELDLFLNSEDKTLDPVFSLTKGQILNITVKYTDNQTGQHINTATLQLIGEGLVINLTRDDILGQYYIILDTTILDIGVKLFTIVAQATNYQIKTTEPRITVSRISATIDTENGASQIEVDVGEDVLLQIVLNDTIFGSIITNATVTYKWAYGQGKLLDPDSDGIYEVTLTNVPSGVYDITITAFAGDDYDFESFEIILIVNQPIVQPGTDLSWLVYVLIGAILGLVSIFISYQTYFKYPQLVRKIRKLKKSVRKGRKTKPILVSNREEIIKNNFEDHKKPLEREIEQPEILDKTKDKSIKKEV